MKFSGQCFCGAVTFQGTANPDKVIACHCRDCQVFSGGPFRAVLPVPVEQVEVVGTPKVFVKVAASGNHRAQAFCGECGTQLYAAEPDHPKVLNFRLGCINERAELKPRVQIWQESSMPWLHELASVPGHTRGMNSSLAQPPGSGPAK